MKGFSRPSWLLILFAAAASAQTSPAPPSTSDALAQNPALVAPKYEVASIRPNKSGTDVFMGTDPFDFSTFTATNTTLDGLLQVAFGVNKEYRVAGMPNWLKTEKYDISAKTDRALGLEIQKLSNREDRRVVRQRMLQALLEDRLQLRFHRETRQLQIYSLVVVKVGKLHQAEDDCVPPSSNFVMPTLEPGKAPPCGGFAVYGVPLGIHLGAHKISAAQIAAGVSSLTGQIVIDRTGLTGKYDFTLEWTPEQRQLEAPAGGLPSNQPAPLPPETNGPSLFTAIQEQLGLKLESGKGPVEVFVIDHIERPSEN